MINALSKLKFLVVATITRSRRRLSGSAQGVRRARRLADPDGGVPAPCSGFAETDGSFTNSARWLQWKWKALDPPGQAKTDQEVLARIFLAVRELYAKEGGALPEQVLNVSWNYSIRSIHPWSRC